MSFLHPWIFAGGLAAVALPLLVHWLTRPRPVNYPLSTIRFVMQAVRQRRAAHRLRDAILLALRMGAIVLLAWALARPLVGARPLVAPGEGGNAVRVVLLDASLSMEATSHGVAAFERARPAAAEYLAYEPGLRADLVLAAARAEPVFDRPSSNFAALRQELDRAAVRPQGLNTDAAINAVAEILAAAQGPAGMRRELVIVSDFQRTNWSAVDFSPLPRDVRIELRSVAPAPTPDNAAILWAGARGRAQQGRELRLRAQVGNYSPAARNVEVEITLGDASYHVSGMVPPAATRMLFADATVSGAGWLAGEARLVGVEDALAADNARSFVVEVRPAPTLALVSRRATGARATSNRLLELGLAPMTGRQAQRVVRVDPESLDQEALAGADLVVLDHPGKLSASAVNLLAAGLRRGRSILYVASEPADAVNLKLLVGAAGTDLKMPVEFSPAPSGQGRRELLLDEVNATEPPFNAFGDGLGAIKGSLRFWGVLASRSLEGGLADDVLARYSDRTAALVVTPCGAGSLAVLNADLESSNLPGSPAFVVLLGELTDRLTSRGQGRSEAVCGEPTAIELPADAGPAAGLSISGPAGETELGSLVDQGASAVWRWPAAGGPGVYQVKRGKETVYALACAAPADESDLAPLDGDVLRTRLAGGRAVHFQATGEEEAKDTLWAWLAMGSAGCLLLEFLALRMFRV